MAAPDLVYLPRKLVSSVSGRTLALVLAAGLTTMPVDLLTPIAHAQTGTEPASDEGLSVDIDDLQNQIDAASEAERQLLQTRQQVSRLLLNADALVKAGNIAGAQSALDEADRTVLPSDQITKNRITLANASLSIRRGDLAGARQLLDGLNGELTSSETARLAAIRSRLDAAQTASDRQAVVNDLTNLSSDAAIDRARAEAARDSGNVNLRLVLADLLRQQGQTAEALKIGEALAAEAAAAADVDLAQRATVLVARIAMDGGDFEAARRHIDTLRQAGETPQKATRIQQLEERMARMEAAAASEAETAARRAAVAEITGLTGDAAIRRAQDITAADPDNTSARILLGDLLRRAGRLGEAKAVGDALLTDTQGDADVGQRQRAYVLLARVALERSDFAGARSYLDQLRASGETPQKSVRVQDLTAQIERAETRQADAARKEQEKRRQAELKAAEAARIKAENDRITAELDAIDLLSGDEQVARAQAFYDTNPGNLRVANAYARVLARNWHFSEAEAVYASMIGSPDAASDAALTENTSAALGLIDLYRRTNRLAEANALLTRLESVYGLSSAAAPERVAVLRQDIDRLLRPDQVSGSITLMAGWNSNVSIPGDDDDDAVDDFLPALGDSSFGSLDARIRYDRVVTPNGDRLRFQARGIERAFFDVDGADRLTFDVNAGYVYNLPGTRTQIQALVGYATRYADYDLYRSTVYGRVDVESDWSPKLSTRTTFTVESNRNDVPGRDGYAYDGGMTVRYEITPQDVIAVTANLRYEDARSDIESRLVFTPEIAYRHAFDLGSITDLDAFVSYSPSFSRFGAAFISGPDAGVTRKDVSHRVRIGLGWKPSPVWRVEAGAEFYSRDSNIRSKNTSATQIGFSITRSFSN